MKDLRICKRCGRIKSGHLCTNCFQIPPSTNEPKDEAMKNRKRGYYWVRTNQNAEGEFEIGCFLGYDRGRELWDLFGAHSALCDERDVEAYGDRLTCPHGKPDIGGDE